MDGKTQQWELYDLSMDRAETNDLAVEHPEIVNKLAKSWQAKLEEYRRLATSEISVPAQ